MSVSLLLGAASLFLRIPRFLFIIVVAPKESGTIIHILIFEELLFFQSFLLFYFSVCQNPFFFLKKIDVLAFVRYLSHLLVKKTVHWPFFLLPVLGENVVLLL